MAYNFFRPKGGRFGTATLALMSGQIGGTNYAGGASPLTVNTTTTFRLGCPPVKCRFKSISTQVVTVPVDADGTILAVAHKYNGSSQVAQTGNIDLEALTTRVGLVTAGTATEPNRLFNGTTDVLEIVVTNNSAAIDTQPAGLVWVAVFEILA